MNGNDPFACSICGEPSTTICCYCTHDACANHLCERCARCSDCCTCEMQLKADKVDAHQPEAVQQTFVSEAPLQGGGPIPSNSEDAHW